MGTGEPDKGYLSAELEAYAAELQTGKYKKDSLHAKPAPYFAKAELEKFLVSCCLQSI